MEELTLMAVTPHSIEEHKIGEFIQSWINQADKERKKNCSVSGSVGLPSAGKQSHQFVLIEFILCNLCLYSICT